MTPRAPHRPLNEALARHYGRLRRALLARHALRAAAAAAAILTSAVVLGALVPLGPGGSWARLVLTIALAAGAVAAGVARFVRARPSFDGYLERIEERFQEVHSWLRNGLEFEATVPAHSSEQLAQAVRAETVRRLEGVPLARLRPRVEPWRPALLWLGSLGVIVLIAAASPARVDRSWTTLWNPSAAAPPVRLAVEPGSVRITPGAALAVRARVWGSASRPQMAREGGPAVAAVFEGRAEGGSRVWRFDLSQLTREQYYRVRVAGVSSPRYHIGLAGEPQPLSFEVELHAPRYARLPVQRGAGTRGDLTGLHGTRAAVEVTFDRDLDSLTGAGPGGEGLAWRALTPRRWRGEIAIEREGSYELHAIAASGESRFRYRVTPLADAPPVLAVRVPEGDLDLPAGQQIPLEVLGQDDLGLSQLRLQYRKDPAAPWAEHVLARFEGEPREARVRASWDASALALLPGETASFRFELLDGNVVSGPGRAVSPTFELRFPTLGELYDQLDRRQAGVQSALERVADQAREQQKALDRLARQQPQPRPSSPQPPSAFERSTELKTALERQQDLARDIEQASQQLRQSLEQAAERQAFNDELMRKMRELAELTEQIQSRELREAIRRMQEAIENLDRERLERDLQELRLSNEQMLAQLDRSIELLKRLREEERLESLARRAAELKEQQDALNREGDAVRSRPDPEQAARTDSALADRQERAAGQSEQLAQDVRGLGRELSDSRSGERLEQSARDLEQNAAGAQREAAQAGRRQMRAQASQSGRRASQELQRVAERLSMLAEEMQREREGADLAAVRRAAQDLVSLQRSVEANLESSEGPRIQANRQTDLSDGVARVADSLFTLARQSPFLSPRLSEALGRGIRSLSESGRELGQGNRARGEQSGQLGAQALNEAVLELRSTEAAMCRMPNQGQGASGGNTAQRLGELGERQSQLNRETRSVSRRLSEQLRLAAGDRQELERLAREQQRIREQLEQIQRDEERERKLLGKLDAAQRDMKEVEETIRQGATDGDLERKQQRILSRLLDAQRSINRRDFDPERESRPGEDIARSSPPELPPDLVRPADRLRLDLLKAEADRYPAQYRAFIEAYLRSLNRSGR